ncbi:hypothetical protein [Sphingomonas alba]|uniref:DUF1311 domain-containing protein n=1 Tax=Sphingomonas alba TaxID=2908208 RepID=A0ABT0RNF8_9SPHN|nr:hypothetical protein [Sphingomonas alba]MCL6684186.1 hypothetical protein [Sphingomonas alba]
MIINIINEKKGLAMSILFALLLVQAGGGSTGVNNASPQAPLPKIKEPLECRIMVAGVSRSSDITVCKARAAWRELELCKGATRYCSPEEKAAIAAKHTAFSLSEDSRIICRLLSATGSRLRTQQTCMAQREWQRMWDESRATMGHLQNKQSTRPENVGQ